MQFQPSAMPDEWGTTQDGQTRPRVVKRGVDDDQDEVPDGKSVFCSHFLTKARQKISDFVLLSHFKIPQVSKYNLSNSLQTQDSSV